MRRGWRVVNHPTTARFVLLRRDQNSDRNTLRSSSKPASFASRVVILSLLASVLYVLPGGSDAESSLARPGLLHRFSHWIADLDSGSTRGVGVRMATGDGSKWLDLRLKGFPGRDGTSRDEYHEFEASPKVRVTYERGVNRVKEVITVSDNSIAEFRFRVRAKGLEVRQVDGVVQAFEGEHMRLRVDPPVAWDADGTDIPARYTLSSDATELLISLDRAALAVAQAPITIDPPIDAGTLDCNEQVCRPLDQGGGSGNYTPPSPDQRRLFVAPDSSLLYFYSQDVAGGKEVAYIHSSDRGESWSTPTVLFTADIGQFGMTDDGSGGYVIAYARRDSSGQVVIGYRRLTGPSTGLAAGGEKTHAPIGASKAYAPSVAYLGTGDLGEKVLIGYPASSATGAWRYETAYTESSGSLFSISNCTNTVTGAVAVRGAQGLCYSLSAGEVVYSTLASTGWTAPVQTGISGADQVPAFTTSDDGAVHVVAKGLDPQGSSHGVIYSRLGPTATAFDPPKYLGPGSAPVISTRGTSLHVYAHKIITTFGSSYQESQILPYIATDGVNFIAAHPFSGGEFDHVIDYNASWGFENLSGDALFILQGPTNTYGNSIGASGTEQRIDHPDERVSFSFTVPLPSDQTVSVSTLGIWLTAFDPPRYRVGLQSDSQGSPSGQWLDESRVGGELVSGAYVELPAHVNTGGYKTYDLPDTTITGGARYHLVVETIRDDSGLLGGNASTHRWVQVQTTSIHPATPSDLKAQFQSTSGAWNTVEGQVPRMVVSSSSSSEIVAQRLSDSSSPQPIHAYNIPAQSFVSPASFSVTQVYLNIATSGTPIGGFTLRLLEADYDQLQQTPVTPTAAGWLEVMIPEVSLTEGERYYLVAHSTSTDTAHFFTLRTNNASPSFEGDTSRVKVSFDAPGFNHRTAEAKTLSGHDTDIASFNSSSSDALYLGAKEPFDVISLRRKQGFAGPALAVTYSYFDGTGYVPIPTVLGDVGATYGGHASFDPPSNWQKSSVDGILAYWIKVTAPSPQRILIERLSTVGDRSGPTAPERSSSSFGPLDHIPLIYLQGHEPRGLFVELYDATPPFLVPQHLVPRDGSNAVFSNQKLMVRITDYLGTQTIDGDSIIFELTDLGSGFVTSYPASSWDVGSGWAVTDQIPLVPGRSYAIKVSVRDLFGNSSVLAHERGFLSTAASANPGSAEIAPTTCQLSAESSNGEREVTCPNVWLNVAGGDVAMTGTQHTGNGYVLSQTDLTAATISTEQNGELLEVPAFSPGARTSLERTFTASQISSQNESYALTTGTVSLGDVVQSVPESWSSAVISLSGQLTTETLDLCGDPSMEKSAWHSPICTPDPIADPFLVTLREDTPELNQVAAAIASTSQMKVISSKGVRLLGHVSPTNAKQIAQDQRVASVIEVGLHPAIDIWGEPDSAGTCRWHTLQAGGAAEQAISLDFDPRGTDCGPSFDSGALIVTTNIGQIGGGGGGGGGGGACLSPMHFSASHEIKDPPQQTLVWLRAYAKAHTDCTYVWWDTADMRVRTGKSRTEQFSGDPLCWWMADSPTASADFSTTKKEVTAEFQGWYHVRKPPPYWDSSCTADAWLPIVWSGAQCDVMIWGEVYATPHSIRWTTDKAFYETDPTGFSCSNFLNSRTSTSSNGDQWTGYPEDNCVAIKPSGNEDVACD